MLCSDYTADVDKQFKSASRRTHAQLKGISSILRGIATALDYNVGQKLLEEENYSDYEAFFESTFEIARRHKIMNPEKMRTEYGKMIYLLQDVVSPSIQPHLSFSCKVSHTNDLRSETKLDFLVSQSINSLPRVILEQCTSF